MVSVVVRENAGGYAFFEDEDVEGRVTFCAFGCGGREDIRLAGEDVVALGFG